MAISDLFSTSFLFSIAIIIILIGGLFAYVSYRMAEQDHKLTSMVNLISMLAQDLQMTKRKLELVKEDDVGADIQYSSDLMCGGDNSGLISVSDCEEDSEDEETILSEDDETCSDGDETVDDDDDECELDTGLLDGDEDKGYFQEHLKMLNLSLANEDIEAELPIEELEQHQQEDIKTIHLEGDSDLILGDDTDLPTQTNNNILDLKTISIIETEEAKTDYKKMSLNKLREIVVSKGLVSDSSKLKKQEILKMLGDE